MKSLHILAEGPFGRGVAEQLMCRVDDAASTLIPEKDHHFQASRFPLAKVHVFVASRPVSRLFKTMDTLAHNWKTPWLPVVLEHPYLRIGPFIEPTRGESCYHCFERRYLQHHLTPDYLQALYHYYDHTPTAGPKGHLKVFTGLAAAHTTGLLNRYHFDGTSVIDDVWQINLLTRESIRSKVVGIHGCPRCGLGREESDRSVRNLVADLDYLLPEGVSR